MGHEGHEDHDEHEGGPHGGRGQVHARGDVPGQAHARENELARGGGAGKVLFLDAPSGLAGDMIIAALVDLGVPPAVIQHAVASLPIDRFHLHFGERVRSGIVATSFDVHVDEGQPMRTYASIRSMLDAAPLESGVRDRAQRTFRRLAEAEAKVHKTSIDDVHFHEVGAVDAIVDVVGSAAALEHVGADLYVSPLPMGRGYARAAHGTLPLPPPATVECLRGFATYETPLAFEFVTPTGAAIVGAHALGSEGWPSMAPERVGWGAGTADLSDRPNLLRAVLGTPWPASRAGGAKATHAVLEVNLDDATGELAAAWIEALLASGALDAWATPITMKKGRPALTLSAIAPVERADAVAVAMLRETTSLGVRRHDVTRFERPRTMDRVATPYGEIPVKVATGPFGPPQVKPEFDACAAAARAHGVPVREVIRAALAAWRGPAP
ncbi:MAG TPA: nickel pincer cofactor biosynthesis protein LarC [Polyangiaceae bacterium]|nr:nickel pincer cofactor biosynthesis protein LarC [Polyangiaceae bacterium]